MFHHLWESTQQKTDVQVIALLPLRVKRHITCTSYSIILDIHSKMHCNQILVPGDSPQVSQHLLCLKGMGNIPPINQISQSTAASPSRETIVHV
jgi:hypothetical protein